MGLLRRLLLVFLGIITPFYSVLVSAETYSVKIKTDQYVNVVSKNFLSFTVDPKYLFSSSEKYGNKECLCMASSLTPAYLRIAGPSTAHMTFRNTTNTIDNNIDGQPRKLLSNLLSRNKKRQAVEKLQVTSDQWKRFATWAKATGFEIVFALNNKERMKSGLWDPNSTLQLLSVAEKAGINDVFWQLGYECSNQTIDDYLNDLETLRVIVDTFPPTGWRAAGGDVTRCLRARSKSDFKDYVTLALDLSDAVMLDGNSSSHELERLSSSDRMKLLKLLQASTTPLWLTERPQKQKQDDLARAADWVASLGYSARNGFDVHYRELDEEELYRPTLSFYMALLFKNLVGDRVLAVDIDSSQTLLFAHCTSLRQQAVPGAVTLYGVNMDDEPARLSVKLSQREGEGDILQFILGHDDDGYKTSVDINSSQAPISLRRQAVPGAVTLNMDDEPARLLVKLSQQEGEGDILQFILGHHDDGNIIVNGRVMSQEGDIRPVVKRVRAYKTLLINLPPKSFGFWVIANTKVEACRDFKDGEGKFVEALPVDVEVNKELNKDTKTNRRKRSLKSEDLNDLNFADITNFDENNDLKCDNKEWNDKVDDLNNYLKDVHSLLRKTPIARTKRQMVEENLTTKKLRRQLLKTRKDLMNEEERKPILSLIENLLQLTRRNGTKYYDKIRHSLKLHRRQVNRRQNKIKKDSTELQSNQKLSRHRRNVENKYKKHNKEEDLVTDNDIEVEDKENRKLWKVLHSIQSQLKRMTEEKSDKSQDSEKDDELNQKSESDKLEVKTEISDDSANINFSEIPNHGLLQAAIEKFFSAVTELNTNLNRFWEAFTF